MLSGWREHGGDAPWRSVGGSPIRSRVALDALSAPDHDHGHELHLEGHSTRVIEKDGQQVEAPPRTVAGSPGLLTEAHPAQTAHRAGDPVLQPALIRIFTDDCAATPLAAT